MRRHVRDGALHHRHGPQPVFVRPLQDLQPVLAPPDVQPQAGEPAPGAPRHHADLRRRQRHRGDGVDVAALLPAPPPLQGHVPGGPGRGEPQHAEALRPGVRVREGRRHQRGTPAAAAAAAAVSAGRGQPMGRPQRRPREQPGRGGHGPAEDARGYAGSAPRAPASEECLLLRVGQGEPPRGVVLRGEAVWCP